MPHTSRRTSVFTESLIREMSRVAARHGAINLSQGFPDWDPPPALIQAAKDARDGKTQTDRGEVTDQLYQQTLRGEAGNG